MRDHYEKLLGYKSDLNNVIQKCNSAIGKYEAMEAAVAAVSQTDLSKSYSKSYIIDVGPIYKVEYKKETQRYEPGDVLSYSATTEVIIHADAIA